jgi:DNA polymerase III epsilon subunit-like protein
MKKLCPNCEELLKPTSNPEVGQCSGCGWSGHYWRAAKEPVLPTATPNLRYVSIDIETTGLDPETCQILEIGAVWDDWTKPIDELPVYHRLVYHKEYRGSAYALAMNANLLRHLSGQQEPWWRDPEQVADDFAAWLKGCGWDGQAALTPAGKNFASFDRQFLKRLPRFEQAVKLSHRTLDPAILYWQPSKDDKLPDSKTCYERAGLDGKVAHNAVEDALAVVRLVRMGIKRLKQNL